MTVLVDTSVWSLALRRNAPISPVVEQLRRFIADDEVVIFGAIRQELLSGLPSVEQFCLGYACGSAGGWGSFLFWQRFWGLGRLWWGLLQISDFLKKSQI